MLEVHWLGRIEYARASALQLETFEARSADRIPDQLLLLEHPPVYTQGSKAEAGDRNDRFPEIPTVTADRGGATTYHGPGQLVGYPIVKLAGARRDLHRYVRDIEATLIGALGELGITAGVSERGTGVWVGPHKVASIGVRVARWVTRHGFALNVDPRLEHFQGIVPCGLTDVPITSIRQVTGVTTPMDLVVTTVGTWFARTFGYDERMSTTGGGNGE